jgi:hypothetical protein
MDAGSLTLLRRLIAMGANSLLRYASEAAPWATEKTAATLANLQTFARQELDATTHITRFLQKKHLRVGPIGSYPSHFTTGNFVSVDYLLPKLVAEHEYQVREIESQLPLATDEEARAIAERYLGMKQIHLQVLKDALPATPPAAVAS